MFQYVMCSCRMCGGGTWRLLAVSYARHSGSSAYHLSRRASRSASAARFADGVVGRIVYTCSRIRPVMTPGGGGGQKGGRGERRSADGGKGARGTYSASTRRGSRPSRVPERADSRPRPCRPDGAATARPRRSAALSVVATRSRAAQIRKTCRTSGSGVSQFDSEMTGGRPIQTEVYLLPAPDIN